MNIFFDGKRMNPYQENKKGHIMLGTYGNPASTLEFLNHSKAAACIRENNELQVRGKSFNFIYIQENHFHTTEVFDVRSMIISLVKGKLSSDPVITKLPSVLIVFVDNCFHSKDSTTVGGKSEIVFDGTIRELKRSTTWIGSETSENISEELQLEESGISTS